MFLITDAPFLYLGIKFNKQRDCHKYYTRFNFFDILVTCFSALYIIVEEWEHKQRIRLYGKHIVEKIHKIQERDFEDFKE